MTSVARASTPDLMNSFPFSDGDFRQIARTLHEETGIYLSDAKAPFVYSRLTKRLRVLGLSNFRDYCEIISLESNSGERQQMIAALTTNVTRFFREPHHFEHLKCKIGEDLAPRLRAGGRLRFWSAACSNGQEPYSIAMAIFSVIPDADAMDVRVLATDIDPNMISAAKCGRYSEEVVSAVPNDLRKKWFHRTDEGFEIDKRLASIVVFRELNLIRPWPMKGRFDAIFCRNVAIYFEEATQQKIWSRFVPLLNPGGALYIGHSERITGPASQNLVADGVTTYRIVKGVSA